MEANELRIGNLIENHTEISVVGIWHLKILDSIQENRFKPILLTEEWLLRLGFTKRGDTGQYYLKDNTLSIHDDGALFWLSENFGKKIRYVHQLQNLYFALTGNELTIQN